MKHINEYTDKYNKLIEKNECSKWNEEDLVPLSPDAKNRLNFNDNFCQDMDNLLNSI